MSSSYVLGCIIVTVLLNQLDSVVTDVVGTLRVSHLCVCVTALLVCVYAYCCVCVRAIVCFIYSGIPRISAGTYYFPSLSRNLFSQVFPRPKMENRVSNEV